MSVGIEEKVKSVHYVVELVVELRQYKHLPVLIVNMTKFWCFLSYPLETQVENEWKTNMDSYFERADFAIMRINATVRYL